MTAPATEAPKTLLQMAGADLDPSALSKSTLLIIDAQNEYRSGGIPLPGVDGSRSAPAICSRVFGVSERAAVMVGGSPLRSAAH